ncbi:MAG: hypothetical protein WCK51_15740 [Armatimonadota bacterium]
MANEKATRLEAIVGIKTGEDKTHWKKVGVAFPLKNRPGYSVKLELLPTPTNGSYEFILVEPSAKKTLKK